MTTTNVNLTEKVTEPIALTDAAVVESRRTHWRHSCEAPATSR